MISNNLCDRRIACLWATRTASSSVESIPAASQTGRVSSNSANASRSVWLQGSAATSDSNTPSVWILFDDAPAPTRAMVVAESPLMIMSNWRSVDRVNPGRNRQRREASNADPVSSRQSGILHSAALEMSAGHKLPDIQTAMSGFQ